jgi:hypothetical protein
LDINFDLQTWVVIPDFFGAGSGKPVHRQHSLHELVAVPAGEVHAGGSGYHGHRCHVELGQEELKCTEFSFGSIERKYNYLKHRKLPVFF